MGDEFLGLSGSWWSSTRCGGGDETPVSFFGWSQSPAAADGNAGCLALQESLIAQTSTDHLAQSFNAENFEPYSNLKDISHGFLTIDPSSSETAMNNMPLFSPSGFSLLDNLIGFEARSHQPDKSGDLQSLQERNFSIKNTTCNNGNSDFCSIIRPLQFIDTGFEEKNGINKSTTKFNSEETTRSSYSSRSKKPRIVTTSPLPTFKVRKEKLGDRITALQQLVSPFGKTDTASVLYEAIDYIKFLHEKVRKLSSPYLRNGSQINNQQKSHKTRDGDSQNQQLRSRGLCLVPISSTFVVACSEIPPIDLWNPAFGMISYT